MTSISEGPDFNPYAAPQEAPGGDELTDFYRLELPAT